MSAIFTSSIPTARLSPTPSARGFLRLCPQHSPSSSNTISPLVRQYESDEELIQDITSPILNWQAGAVHVGLDLSGMKHEKARVNGVLLLIVFGATVLGIVLSFIFSSFITGPLEKLSALAEQIGAGRFNMAFVIKRNDEIGSLSASINRMAQSLKNNFTRRLQIENQLADEKERLAVTMRSIGDGVIATDLQGKIILLNKMAERLTGWNRRDAQILAIDADAKVIAASGYSNDPIMSNYTDYGFCAALAKPFEIDELKKTINQVLA